MLLAKIEGGEVTRYPYTLAQLRADNPRISLPLNPSAATLARFNVVPVTRIPAPDADHTKTVTEGTPVLQDGAWVQVWEVRDATEEEIAHRVQALKSQVNAERDRRLLRGAAFAVPGAAEAIPLTGRPEDRTVYLALLVQAQGAKAAGITTPALRFRDDNDTIHLLTPDQMIALIAQAMQWFEAVMAVSWAMKDGDAPFEAGIPEDFADDRHWP